MKRKPYLWETWKRRFVLAASLAVFFAAALLALLLFILSG